MTGKRRTADGQDQTANTRATTAMLEAEANGGSGSGSRKAEGGAAGADQAPLVIQRLTLPPTATDARRQRRRSAARAQKLIASTCSDLPEAHRIVQCGRASFSTTGVVLKRTAEGLVYPSGVVTCGSPWSCLRCSYKIRAKRARHIAQAVSAHIESGGGVLFGTFTMSHDRGEDLDRLWTILSQGWAYMTAGRQWVDFKTTYGLVGWVKSVEVTHGETTDRFTAWRTWRDGEDKITGRAKAYPPFEQIRALSTAADQKALYNEIRQTLELPAWSNRAAVESAMFEWELENPERLEDAEVSDTHLFGFNSRGRLSELFDFVFVSADLRASEEAVERKDSLLDRIIRRAIRRDAFELDLDDLVALFDEKYEELGQTHLAEQFEDLADKISTEVSAYSRGKAIQINHGSGTFRAPAGNIEVQVADRGAITPVTHQGHGFQRTLLLAGLTVLSRQSREGDQSSSMFLAIEEPELFQHPTQARAFSSVLRSLAEDPSQRTQVAYATHSPHFVSPEHFDEVRRISSVLCESGSAESRLTQASIDAVAERLDGFVKTDAVARRFEQVCLKSLPDALFAERVILVEGDDDAAIVEGVGHRVNEMAINGICVAPVFGKSGMMIPFAILEALEVEAMMVVDNDSGCGDRMRANGRDTEKVAQQEASHAAANRSLCEFVGAAPEDYPVGNVGRQLVFVPDTLESLLDSELPGWNLCRQELIDEGRGVDGKHAATYALAVRECDDEVGPTLKALALSFVGEAA